MITEQRLRFEARHRTPDILVYDEKTNSYVFDPRCPKYLQDHSKLNAHNALWQGYQSALEDRQGEAVGWVLLQSDGKMVESTDGENAIVWRASPDDEGPINGYMVAYMDSHCPDKAPHRWQALFTSPQPAQPDQWNAAIEALKGILENDGGEGSKCFDAQKLFQARMAGFLALRKGA